MADQPHETPEFRNAAEFTVMITFKVAGGVRPRTAEGRARKVAERLAAAATRMAGVVEVSARGGVSFAGEVHWPSPISFAAASAGCGEQGRLTRYLDPGHERALRSLAAANAADRERRQADQDRRRAVGCANAYPSLLEPSCAPCECVYCLPGERAGPLDTPAGERLFPPRCLCGVPVPAEGGRCLAHRGVELVVLDGDAQALVGLAEPPERTHESGLDR